MWKRVWRILATWFRRCVTSYGGDEGALHQWLNPRNNNNKKNNSRKHGRSLQTRTRRMYRIPIIPFPPKHNPITNFRIPRREHTKPQRFLPFPLTTPVSAPHRLFFAPNLPGIQRNFQRQLHEMDKRFGAWASRDARTSLTGQLGTMRMGLSVINREWWEAFEGDYLELAGLNDDTTARASLLRSSAMMRRWEAWATVLRQGTISWSREIFFSESRMKCFSNLTHWGLTLVTK